ncbi:DNA internalization-related competence protein ComEC/Rec2 [Frateuria sp. STR12]|uniref:DNA internalization-related competence protein ComEC/Rec2 n=1 Tax=Frateuria hangzhouensis TaxID=2995589 RepID=UPI002260E330|nr:DNA internalization-related competence protein ComEC/Rec2 [Frateuria sp. STR12]MCX7512387.1 DNA internalization-related competence protein ComEC/Rec2 [Frateuria sp. STR12]
MHEARMPGAAATGIALLLGVAAVQWLPALPPPAWGALPGLVMFWASLRWPKLRVPALVLLGVAWAIWRGTLALDLRLPRELERRDFDVSGTLSGLPQVREDATRFMLHVDRATLDGKPVALHGRVRLSWYDDAPALPACSRWQLHVRLRRPRGLLNPGGYDSERSALEKRIAATGYVRAKGINRWLGTARCVDGVRERIARGIAARVADPHDAALLQSFSIGDTRGLSQDDWEVARGNGVSHLIAISGFHVGMAALFGIALVRLLYLLGPGLALRLPRLPAQAAAALLAAGLYGALAGFGLPTVRTLLMIAVVALARCSRRAIGGAQTLGLAMVAMLIADPLAVLSAGFWLSFIGVAFLMLCLNARPQGLRGFLHELTAGQLVMTVALLPLTLWFFGEASLVGALSNLIAVPFVSFVIVPCALLGMLLLLLAPPTAAPVLKLAAVFVHAQWWLLERMASWPGAHWYLPEVGPWALLLATLGALWLFAPRGLPLRGLGLLLFLPLVWPVSHPPAEGGFQAWVLDVGQGLSVVVRTRHHALVYDAGARYPSGFDLGDAVVVPALHALGIDRLDLLAVSHADNDHAGGAPAVAKAFPHAARLAGEPRRMQVPMHPCVAGQAWHWDGVGFRMLSPSPHPAGRRNDRSCVLAVDGAGGRLLLTGDISSRVEPAVAAAIGPERPTVLVVPHHGSRHSSDPAFIAAAAPRLALVSAGWHNRFGHPHPLVVQRYADAGVPLLNTATRGAIEVVAQPTVEPAVKVTWRQRHPRYWRE